MKKPEYIIQHEDQAGKVRATIKFTGKFDKAEIQKAVLICVSNMENGDEIELAKNDHSMVYVGNIPMMILHKKKGDVKRMIMRGTGAGRYVHFHYFQK